MQLKRFTDLGLRVLYYLSDKTDRPIAIAEIADALQWSRNHIVKVARFMVQQGWITAVRGRTGGLILAKPVADYRLGDVCRTMEGMECMIDCHEPPCPFLPACGLIPALGKAQKAFFDELNKMTLADAVASPAMQETIIRITSAAVRQNG